MKRIITAIALAGVALIALPGTAAEAEQPVTPEQIRAWATTLPRQPTSLLDPVYSPIDAIHMLDETYAVMVQDFNARRAGDAWTKGGEGSKTIDRYRRLLVHSPDKTLNKLMNSALNQVGDVFDEVNIADTAEAAKKAPRSNRSWAQVETMLKVNGVDTGESWSLSTTN